MLSQPRHEANIKAIIDAFSSGRYLDVIVMAEHYACQVPEAAFFWKALGTAYQQIRSAREANLCLVHALVIAPGDTEILSTLAMVKFELEDRDEAVKILSRSICIDPACANAIGNMGLIYKKYFFIYQAEKLFGRAVVLQPNSPEKNNNFAGVLSEKNDLGGALLYCSRALAIQPSCLDALNNIALIFRGVDRLHDGIRWAQRTIETDRTYAPAFNSRAVLMFDLRRFREARVDYGTCIALSPDNADAKWNVSIMDLLLGDYASGWVRYEARWQASSSRLIGARFDGGRVWGGGHAVEGSRIYLYPEQGLGDTIQFCRYARKVRELGAQVVLQVPDALLRLLRGQEGFGEVIGQSEGVPSFDYHCPLMSLPLAFGTTLETIPYGKEAYLEALPEDVARWRERLGESDRLRVGVVWNGGFRPGQPELWAVNARRNVPLEVFARHLDIEGVDFYSLQKGDPAESELRGREGEYWRRGRLYNYASELHDFADTAGLIANLDLVISVDTSTAHLAAALGKPTWILNRYDTCWRWLLDREDSPWYGSVKLYRQGVDRDWEPVLSKVAEELRGLSTHQRRCPSSSAKMTG